MKRFTHIITSALIAAFVLTGVAAVSSVVASSPVYAAANTNDVQKGIDAVGGNGTGNSAGDFTDLLKSVINILLFIIGAIAVIMIIVGGISYTTSAGDQGKVTSAKNTVLYAVVGLVVAIMAFALVNFILKGLN